MTLRVAAATKATAAAQEARPARAMGLRIPAGGGDRLGEGRGGAGADEVMASCPALEKVRGRVLAQLPPVQAQASPPFRKSICSRRQWVSCADSSRH